MASRLVLYNIVRRWMRQGRLTRRTVVVGGGNAGRNPEDGGLKTEDGKKNFRFHGVEGGASG